MPSVEGPRRSILVRPLAPEHRTAGFSCGNRRIDQYLADAPDYQRHNLGRVFVAIDRETGAGDVLGYYSVRNHCIRARHVSNPLGSMLHREAEVGTLCVIMLGSA